MCGFNIKKKKKCKTVLNAFIKIVNEPNRKLNELWADQRGELYNKLLQEWFCNNDILMYSTQEKSVIPEKFIITRLKATIYKKITANSGEFYLSYLNESAHY